MKCSECQRHNGSNYQFCIHCGSAVNGGATVQTLKQLVPPQDIDELLSDRVALRGPARGFSLHPLAVMFFAAIIGTAGVYYWFFYLDTYQIMAIDYQTSELMDGQ